MQLYDFNRDTYNKIVEIVKFRFYKEIKDTGIVFKEVLSSENLVTNAKFYILVYEDTGKTNYLRFKDSKSFLIQLIHIAGQRLKRLEIEEKALLKVNDVESYGESQYFNDTEMNAIGISSLKELLIHFDKIRIKSK
ncbi:hypothetical protein [Aquimarina algiphila]|uniref:hypothetical protein n=1 Tax=Aquimarina algiphila TaxID=2047982 RepID=UPI00232E5515|nr:hypothetical protein [Aquimarina algiphila]